MKLRSIIPVPVAMAFFAMAIYGQEQPLPYSHKTHLALGLKCNSCHRNPEPGEAMGFPAEAFCMGCHQSVKSDSPNIKALAAAAKDKQPIAWNRVYRIPTFVYFSHKVHLQAGATCEKCHGPVRDRDVIAKEVVHDMRSCVACHKASNAPATCTTCHEER